MIKTNEEALTVLKTINLLVEGLTSFFNKKPQSLSELEEDIDSILNMMPSYDDIINDDTLHPTKEDLIS